jgi:RNA polymerase subunit RPABC4/transcription elongation factor Spt4
VEAILARIVHVTIAVGGAYFLALWFALVVWTFRDIQERSRSVIAQIFSTLVVVLFSVPGVLLYLLLRPKETLDEAFERSLQEEYLLQDMEGLALCPQCQRLVAEDFLFCPYCRTQLRLACTECGRAVDVRWAICPYCGTEQEAAEPLPAPSPGWALPDLSRLARSARRSATGGPLSDDAAGSELTSTLPTVQSAAKPGLPLDGARPGQADSAPSAPSATSEDTSEIPPVGRPTQ